MNDWQENAQEQSTDIPAICIEEAYKRDLEQNQQTKTPSYESMRRDGKDFTWIGYAETAPRDRKTFESNHNMRSLDVKCWIGRL